MKKRRKIIVWQFFFFNYFQIFTILYIPLIVSEKSNKNLSDYIQFILKKSFEVNRKGIFSIEKLEIQEIIFKIMLTRSSEKICNQMRYMG